MRISIMSDCHCGYDFNGERGEDSFNALSEAIEKSGDSDLILIAGDLFDTRIPKQDVIARVAKILTKAQMQPSRAKLLGIINKNGDEISPLAFRGTPVVCIHGNHDRRSKHLLNPVQTLEHAGLILHLHAATALFEIDGERVAIHGLSAVPERETKAALETWSPKPVEGAKNIFMIHQNITPYIYNPLEPPSISIDDLPKGFDVYVLGHMHWSEMREHNNGILLMCGSTAPTSIHKIESEQKKSFYIYDGKGITRIPLESQRKIFWEEFELGPNTKDQIATLLSSISHIKPKPIVALKIKGTLPKNVAPPNFSDVIDKFKDRMLITVTRKFDSETVGTTEDLIQLLREQRLSPEEHGMKILQNFMKQTNCKINHEEIFEMLVEGQGENVLGTLLKQEK